MQQQGSSFFRSVKLFIIIIAGEKFVKKSNTKQNSTQKYVYGYARITDLEKYINIYIKHRNFVNYLYIPVN